MKLNNKYSEPLFESFLFRFGEIISQLPFNGDIYIGYSTANLNFQAALVNDDAPAGFSATTKCIAINRGRCDSLGFSEEEIFAFITHEIGHVMQLSCTRFDTIEKKDEDCCGYEHEADMMAVHMGLKTELCSGLQKMIDSHLFVTEDIMVQRVKMQQSYSVLDLLLLECLTQTKSSSLIEEARCAKLKPQGSPLTDAENMVVRMLCRAEFSLIQNPLAQNRIPNSLEHALIQLLDSALLRLPKVGDARLTRADIIGDIANYHIGQSIDVPYFLTTSRRPMTNVSGIKFLWVIDTKPSSDTRAHDLTPAIEDQFAESQVEFERNTRFLVKEICVIDTEHDGCIPVLHVEET